MGKANTAKCSMDCFHCEFADCIQNGWMTTPFEKEQLRIRDEKKAAQRAAQRERSAHQRAIDKQFAAWVRKNLKRGRIYR